MWPDCAESFAKARGNSLRAKEVLEDYFAKITPERSASYSAYETAPMRMLAGLLKLQSGDFRSLPVILPARAYGSKHKCPMDVMVCDAQAPEASGDIVECPADLRTEAMKLNDQMPGLKELNERLSK